MEGSMARRPHPYWWKSRKAYYVTIDKVRHRLSEDKTEAMRLFHEMMARPKKKVSVSSVAVLFDDFLDWCYENRAKLTGDRYKDFLQRFADKYGTLHVSSLTPEHVTVWLKGQEWNSTTKHNAITAIQRAFNWGVRNSGLRENPIKGMEKPKAQRRTSVVTSQEFEEMLSIVKDQDFRDLLIVSFDCGARPFEIKELEARHVELGRQRAVIPAEEAKKNIPRAFYFPTDRSMEIIRRLVAERPEGLLFLTTRGTPWNRFNVRCRFQRLQEKMGKRFRHYDFRRSWITRKIIAGVDSHVVAQLSGHRSTKMIDDHYSVIADDYQFMLQNAQKDVTNGCGEEKKPE
jgi:integrase